MEDGVDLLDVFFKLDGAFVPKPQRLVDFSVFVASSKEVNVFGVLELQCEEQQDQFKTFSSTVNVVTQKQIVGRLNIAQRLVIGWSSEGLKEAIQIVQLPVQIPNDLDGNSKL